MHRTGLHPPSSSMAQVSKLLRFSYCGGNTLSLSFLRFYDGSTQHLITWQIYGGSMQHLPIWLILCIIIAITMLSPWDASCVVWLLSTQTRENAKASNYPAL